jgi:murein DD-endopeptidase MepM/ murein hydrolase activator NlpD
VIPPELAGDPRAPFLVDPGPGDGADIPIAQNSFDPLSVAVRPELVSAATAAVDAATAVLTEAQRQVVEQTATVTALTSELAAVEGRSRAAVSAAAEARKELLDRAVTAYLVGDLDERLALMDSDDVVDMGVARNYVGAVAGSTRDLVERYERARDGLSRDQAQLADDLAAATTEMEQRTTAARAAWDHLLEKVQELQAFQAGAQAYIDGFVFPVAGDVEFIDSWGYPRMSGTPSAHWHQGTDVFAAYGTPLIASENGVLARIGVGSLGGNKLWVNGDSGTEYYYAHLAAFAPGITEGQRVRAGEVVGYVGDTGNARGTSPHLHFEVHPGGLGPVNPYPILKAAYGNRPVARATAPTTTTTTTVAPVPAASGTDGVAVAGG